MESTYLLSKLKRTCMREFVIGRERKKVREKKGKEDSVLISPLSASRERGKSLSEVTLALVGAWGKRLEEREGRKRSTQKRGGEASLSLKRGNKCKLRSRMRVKRRKKGEKSACPNEKKEKKRKKKAACSQED